MESGQRLRMGWLRGWRRGVRSGLTLPPVDLRAVCLVRAIVKDESVLVLVYEAKRDVEMMETRSGWPGKEDAYI